MSEYHQCDICPIYQFCKYRRKTLITLDFCDSFKSVDIKKDLTNKTNYRYIRIVTK